MVGAGLFAGALMPRGILVGAKPRADSPKGNLPTPERRLTRFDLLAITPDELAKVDIAAMNLACAEELPGFEGVDPKAVLAKLDEWAAKVKTETERHLYRAKDPKYAEHYHNSENYLRAEFLIQTLQEDCGVRYNPVRIYTPDFSDSRDSFIHGMLDPKQGGTCASMPVLYAAIGRRLGYPVKLVSAKQHLFCRWESHTERFNIEGSSNGGWDSYPDDHYKMWPKPISQAEIEQDGYLKPKTPSKELADFLLARASCEAVNRQLPAARASLAEAHRLDPECGIDFRAFMTTFGAAPGPRAPMRLPRPDAGLGPPDPTPGLPVPGGGRPGRR